MVEGRKVEVCMFSRIFILILIYLIVSHQSFFFSLQYIFILFSLFSSSSSSNYFSGVNSQLNATQSFDQTNATLYDMVCYLYDMLMRLYLLYNYCFYNIHNFSAVCMRRLHVYVCMYVCCFKLSDGFDD